MPLMELVYEVEGQTRRYLLSGNDVSIGRSSENGIVLNDFSVSRKHALLSESGGVWTIEDLKSTNGLKVNGEFTPAARIKPGDVLTVGTFTLTVNEQPTFRGRATASISDSSATFVRSIADFNRDFGFDAAPLPKEDVLAGTMAGRRPATREKVFEAMVLVARTLIEAREVGQILSKVVDLLFDFLPAERAVVVLLEKDGRPTPTLARRRGREGSDPEASFSHTIVESVVRDRVAVLTSDALADDRFEAGQSIRIQQIRSAMCVPLWDRDRVIGALHVDTPLKAGTFTADDLDLLTALGNFAAVAIERARLQGRIEREERIRERLSRYHSPGVVDEIVTGGPQGVESVRTREVTVFFADIVGFTSSAETMDPEEVSRFLERVFTFAADAIFEQGGTLDKFIGDAVMAFFGAPIPQPDHARRAVAAAAKLIESLHAWNLQRAADGEPSVAVRVGVNTGRAFVGDIGSDRRVDYTVLGNTVNVAARLESTVAGPNEVVVGVETARQAGGTYEFEPLGEQKLKGLSKGMTAFRLKLDASGRPVTTP
ncbi:MAG TPA: adenylate/guanylate cyclase domain-containing protein [Thermoanaerobaculia bacterium]|nr:adenylate/guanylate cyclase domain-containing protein [Thermoanaerobaculia bacterium]